MQLSRIKDWAVEDRPREKLIQKGYKSLTNAELLAILIGSGTSSLSALELSKMILNSVDNRIDVFSKVTLEELKSFKGIGDAKAITVLAALELGRRRSASLPAQRSKVTSSQVAYDELILFFRDLEHEEFRVLFLNRANEVLSNECISRGGLSGTVADGKLIFNRALQLKASAVILAHNHPSGNCEPSPADKKLTSSLHKFGAYIDLSVLDHLIITENNYFSFADQGLISVS